MNLMYKHLLTYFIILISIHSILALTVEQTVTVNVVPGKINIFSPQAQIYFSRMVPLNISLSDNATFRYAKYSDNGNDLVTLCRDCSDYGEHNTKIKPFDDGFHRVRIVAEFEGGVVEEFVELIVDGKNPMIHKTSPSEGFADGTFAIEFTEENSMNVYLFYGTPDDIRNASVILDQCIKNFFGRRHCTIFVDVKDFDGHDIFYGFTVLDIANRMTLSSIKRLAVDVSAPTIDRFDFNVSGRKVHFLINITEDNFKEIRFIDRSSFFPHWKTLCSTLENDMCKKDVLFFSGAHQLSFEVIDDAGNTAFIDGVEFFIE